MITAGSGRLQPEESGLPVFAVLRSPRHWKPVGVRCYAKAWITEKDSSVSEGGLVLGRFG